MNKFRIGDIVILTKEAQKQYEINRTGWLRGKYLKMPIKITKFTRDYTPPYIIGKIVGSDIGDEQAVYIKDVEFYGPQKTEKEQLLDKIDYLWKKQDYYKTYVDNSSII